MKLFFAVALLALGTVLPACVRSVGVYQDRYPNHLYHNTYGAHYRPTHRPYTVWHHRGYSVYRDHHDHHYRDGAGLRLEVRGD